MYLCGHRSRPRRFSTAARAACHRAQSPSQTRNHASYPSRTVCLQWRRAPSPASTARGASTQPALTMPLQRVFACVPQSRNRSTLCMPQRSWIPAFAPRRIAIIYSAYLYAICV